MSASLPIAIVPFLGYMPKIFAAFVELTSTYLVKDIFPLYDSEIQDEIKEYVRLQMSDNQKLVVLDENHKHQRANQDTDKESRAQMEIFNWLKQKELKLIASKD